MALLYQKTGALVILSATVILSFAMALSAAALLASFVILSVAKDLLGALLEILRYAQDDRKGAQDDRKGAQDDRKGAQDDRKDAQDERKRLSMTNNSEANKGLKIMINETNTWLNLEKEAKSMKTASLKSFFSEPDRVEKFSLAAAGLYLDYSKNFINEDILKQLLMLTQETELKTAIEAMFSGEKINNTDNRAVLHTALRSQNDEPVYVDGQNVMPEIKASLKKMREFVDRIQSGEWLGFSGKRITDIVNVGIGGSDLGPHTVVKALQHYRHKSIRPHFVSNIDPAHLLETLSLLNPETTLFVVSSKSFTTEETLTNASAAKAWLLASAKNDAAVAKHFIAVSAAPEKTKQFGIDENNVFAFRDFVGGRYSLWSAIGLSIALSVGMDNFEELLKGAHEMDKHFRETPFEKNMPVILALLGVWYRNFLDASTYAVIPYAQHLSLLPSFLQQLDMESNGKCVTREGKPVTYKTGPIVWGGHGTNGQHAFHQLFHQGTDLIPIDFILVKESLSPMGDQQTRLFAHCLAQSEALLLGRKTKEIHRDMPGNRPSNILLLDKITPKNLGALIALYEQKIFVQGVIWGINSFDQWGVELGKELASHIFSELTEEKKSEHDTSTQSLIDQYSHTRTV